MACASADIEHSVRCGLVKIIRQYLYKNKAKRRGKGRGEEGGERGKERERKGERRERKEGERESRIDDTLRDLSPIAHTGADQTFVAHSRQRTL